MPLSWNALQKSCNALSTLPVTSFRSSAAGEARVDWDEDVGEISLFGRTCGEPDEVEEVQAMDVEVPLRVSSASGAGRAIACICKAAER